MEANWQTEQSETPSGETRLCRDKVYLVILFGFTDVNICQQLLSKFTNDVF